MTEARRTGEMAPQSTESQAGAAATAAPADTSLDAAFARAARLLRAARHVALVCHEKPDGDALGSVAGLALALDRLGVPHTGYVPDPIPDPYGFIPAADTFRLPEPLPATVDLVVALDASELSRLGSFGTLNESRLASLPIVNIDHHVTNTRFGTVNIVDLGAASTCEVVYRLLPYLGVELDQRLATALGTGLLTDTLGFRTSNTRPSTLRVGAELLEHGAPLPELADLVFRQRKLSTLKLWGLALSNVRQHDGVVWTAATQAMFQAAGADGSETDGLIDLLLGVPKTRVAVLFKEETDGQIKLSLRSTDAVDVSAVALLLGGGGHARAAGATVGRDLAEAERRVLALLRPA